MILGTGNETIAAMSESKTYEVVGKQTNGTVNTSQDKPLGVVNSAYVPDERETTSVTKADIPRGYMPHKEDASKNPVYVPPLRDGKHHSESNGVSSEKVVVKVEEDKPVANDNQTQEVSDNKGNVKHINREKDSKLFKFKTIQR